MNLGFLDADFNPCDNDKDIAWKIYIELVTRTTTQPLSDSTGDEKTALDSVHTVFTKTRELLAEQGRDTQFCVPLALSMLNSIIRPFTAKWHKYSVEGKLNRLHQEECSLFRQELRDLQNKLILFSEVFISIAYGQADKVNVEEFIKSFNSYETI